MIIFFSFIPEATNMRRYILVASGIKATKDAHKMSRLIGQLTGLKNLKETDRRKWGISCLHRGFFPEVANIASIQFIYSNRDVYIHI
jgi:hypothetical protein